jgi:hypothetical protein
VAAADATVIEPLVPEIVAVESMALIVCVPTESRVAVSVAVPLLNETLLKLAPPKLSESVAESLKPVMTLLYWSSAVMVRLVVLPTDTLVGEAETSSWLAAAGVIEIELLVPEIVAVASATVIDCVPAASSVAVSVAWPPLNETAEKLVPPKLSESVTESLNPVTTLLN